MAEKPVLNAASLLDLKAELLRKKAALSDARLKRGLYDNFVGTKLKGIEKEEKVKKAKNPVVLPETNTEEELALKKSRAMLERKAILYEKLQSGVIVPDEEQSENFLVNFDKKVNDMPVRTQHEDFERNETLRNVYAEEDTSVKTTTKYSNFVLAKDDPDKTKDSSVDAEEGGVSGPVHYQNVQFREVRNHGVGYFSFSMDEEERKKQLDALNALRHHTEEEQKALLKKKRKRQAMLKARLAKVRRRKNISSKDDEDEDEEEIEESAESENELENITSVETESDSVQSKTDEEAKPTRVRPWDKGKDFSDLLPERKTKNPGIANLWLDNRRAERVADFAPPQSYSSSSKRTNQNTGFYAPPRQHSVCNAQHEHNDDSYDDDDDAEAARLISEKLSQIKQQF